LGTFDTEARLALYHIEHDKYLTHEGGTDKVRESLLALSISISLDSVKRQVQGSAMDDVARAAYNLAFMSYMRMSVTNEPPARRDHQRREAESRLKKQRQSFNAQHAQAPDGTVRELSAKFGVSLSEVRRMKELATKHGVTVTEIHRLKTTGELDALISATA
jgi:hypothetical protein